MIADLIKILEEGNKQSIGSSFYGFYLVTFAYIFEREKYHLAKHLYEMLTSDTEREKPNCQTTET